MKALILRALGMRAGFTDWPTYAETPWSAVASYAWTNLAWHLRRRRR